ncbi:MAG: hypothetical protein PHI28_09460 [Mangrovibacterium sp.]|nr:hypothetical protein [Mangrovibacterium sp.]
MRILCVFMTLLVTVTVPVYAQPEFNIDDVKYVIFTSDKKAEDTREGVYSYISETKSEPQIAPSIVFRFVSKARGITTAAYNFKFDLDKLSKIRKVTEKDKLVIKEEPDEFLNSVDLVDMDILFPKMTKEEFVEFWNRNLFGNVLGGKKVYFIDRLEIKNHKVKLYPVYITGINLY